MTDLPSYSTVLLRMTPEDIPNLLAKEVCKGTKLYLGNSDSYNFVCYNNMKNSSMRNTYMSFSCYRYRKTS